MTDLSVVITCYNYGAYLDEAVSSALGQTRAADEIIIVDDGSDDPATVALLDRYDRPRTRVIRAPHQGLPAARNLGIRAASGGYVCNLDADDVLDPEYLAATAAVLDADPSGRVGFVSTWMHWFGDEERLWKPLPYDPLALALEVVVHGSSLFRRAAWEGVGGYPESFLEGAEDWAFWVRMVAAGYRWEVVERPLIHYRRHGETLAHRAIRERVARLADVIDDSPELYRENHRALILRLYARLVELENVWHEKQLALDDNETLMRWYRDEQKGHAETRAELERLRESSAADGAATNLARRPLRQRLVALLRRVARGGSED